MDLADAIAGRRAVREYTDETIDEATIRRLIDAAVRAPSAANLQPWTFTVVRDQSLLNVISRNAKAHMLATMPLVGQAEEFRSLLADPAYHIFYHAPVLILISAVTQGPWSVEDCALAAENLMLAAYGEGLGSCWVGFAQSFLKTSGGRQALTLSSDCAPVAPIIIGHPRASSPVVPRKPPVIQWLG